MKRKLLLPALALSFNLLSQIPNSGFENWTNGEPDQWSTTNAPGTSTNVTKVSTAHSGLAAVKLEPFIAGGQTVSPVLAYPNNTAGAVPYVGRPLSFSGWYMSNLVGGDTPMIEGL